MINRADALPGNVYSASLVNCARCGGLHSAVRFVPFRRICGEATHWAACPTTAEPILFRARPSPPPPDVCKAPGVHPSMCGCPEIPR